MRFRFRRMLNEFPVSSVLFDKFLVSLFLLNSFPVSSVLFNTFPV